MGEKEGSLAVVAVKQRNGNDRTDRLSLLQGQRRASRRDRPTAVRAWKLRNRDITSVVLFLRDTPYQRPTSQAYDVFFHCSFACGILCFLDHMQQFKVFNAYYRQPRRKIAMPRELQTS